MKLLISICVIVAMVYYVNLSDELPSADLPVYDKSKSTSRDGVVGGMCPADQCLTVYLAPWCPHCRRATSVLTQLAEDLRSEGTHVDFIVGHDDATAIKTYADKFPFPVSTDADSQYYETAEVEAVPYLWITDGDGTIVNRLAGAARSVSDFRRALEI